MARKQPLDLNALFKQLHLNLRERTICKLLAGNDTGCFTVEQYTDTYLELQKHDDDRIRAGFRRWFLSGLAAEDLQASGSVREVRPGCGPRPSRMQVHLV